MMSSRGPPVQSNAVAGKAGHDPGSREAPRAAPPGRAAARRRAAILGSGNPAAFVCSRCVTWVLSVGSKATPAAAKARARSEGAHSSDLGTEEWRLQAFGPHEVCVLCSGLYVDAQTQARATFGRPSTARPSTSAQKRPGDAKRKRHRYGPDREPSSDILDKPWGVAGGSFEGGKRR